MNEILKINYGVASLETIDLVHGGVTNVFIEKIKDELVITLEFYDGHTETTKIN